MYITLIEYCYIRFKKGKYGAITTVSEVYRYVILVVYVATLIMNYVKRKSDCYSLIV